MEKTRNQFDLQMTNGMMIIVAIKIAMIKQMTTRDQEQTLP